MLILNRPAVKVISGDDGPQTLFYCDPPYLHETRTARKVYGEFEMTEADHRELLAVLKACQGKVILSGYACPLYDEALSGWKRQGIDLANHAAGGRSKRRMTEVLWCNFDPEPAAGGMPRSLFAAPDRPFTPREIRHGEV